MAVVKEEAAQELHEVEGVEMGDELVMGAEVEVGAEEAEEEAEEGVEGKEAQIEMSAWQKRRKQRLPRKEKCNSTCLICLDAIVGKKGLLKSYHLFCLECSECWPNQNQNCAIG